VTAGKRWRVEHGNRAVELALDYEEVKALAGGEGTPLEDLLVRFKSAGVTSVAITEDTLAGLRDTGRLSLSPSSFGPLDDDSPSSNADASAASQMLCTSSHEIAERVEKHLPEKFPFTPQTRVETTARGLYSIAVPTSRELVESVGMGLDRDAVQLAREAGLSVVGRLYDYPSITAPAIDAMAQDLSNAGVQTVIFAAEEVPGYRDLLDTTAEALMQHRVAFGRIEFAKQHGEAQLAEALSSKVVRVHSISVSEMITMSPAEAVERFSRAASERNIRLCYVHLFPQMKATSVEDNLKYVRALSDALRSSGYTLSPARPYEDFKTPVILLFLVAVGVIAAGALLLEEFITPPRSVTMLVMVVGALLIGAVLLWRPTQAAKLVALAAAIIFPALAYCLSGVDERLQGKRNRSSLNRPARHLGAALSAFIKATALSLAGALVVVGALGDLRFMGKTDQFVGIKASQLLPLLLIVLVIATGLLESRGADWRSRWGQARDRLEQLMSRPLLVGLAGIGVLGLAFVALWMARTGNESGVGVSDMEMRFRGLLEQLLVPRPRTKEFLVGHPAFLLGVVVGGLGRRSWAVLLVLLGFVGQASMVNTFCHIHTPLSLSLLRTFNGLWLGVAIGASLCRYVIRLHGNRVARDDECP